MPKKKPYQKQKFESQFGAAGDTSANIYVSMLMSDAWKALSAKQQVLYLYCKAQYYAEKPKSLPEEFRNNLAAFTMNRSKWQDLYELYKRNDEKSFYRDISALIEKGFIRCLECGAFSRTKSIYEFSNKWKFYGTANFNILPAEMTVAMQRKLRKANSEDF